MFTSFFYFSVSFFCLMNISNMLGCFLLHYNQKLSPKVYFLWVFSCVSSIIYAILLSDFNFLFLSATFLFFDVLGIFRYIKNGSEKNEN